VKQNQTKAKDDSAVRPTTSPQTVPGAGKKSTQVMSPEPSTTSDDAPVISPPPNSGTSDEPDIGIKKTGRPTSNKQQSSTKPLNTNPSNEKPEFQGFKLRKTGLSKGGSNKSKV